MKTFYIQQKLTIGINRYHIFESDKSGARGAQIGFAEQKRFAFREKLTLYKDESKQETLLEIQARQAMDLGARYDIKDTTGKVLGVSGKAFKASLLKSTWNIYKPGREEKPYLVVAERSGAVAVARRVWGFIPIIGEFIPFFMKYHFDFVDPTNNEVKASYDKITTLTDNYKLEVQDDIAESLDWRVFVAQGIMLDALQSR